MNQQDRIQLCMLRNRIKNSEIFGTDISADDKENMSEIIKILLK